MVFLQWNVEPVNIGMSHLSTDYIPIPVQVTNSGESYNPTADPVAFAFMPTPTQVPGSGDWVSGSWETVSTNILYPYNAVCLVGPGGATAPTIGTYVIYTKITDSPQVPVLITGQLQIN